MHSSGTPCRPWLRPDAAADSQCCAHPAAWVVDDHLDVMLRFLYILMPGTFKSMRFDAWSMKIHAFACLEHGNQWIFMPGVRQECPRAPQMGPGGDFHWFICFPWFSLVFDGFTNKRPWFWSQKIHWSSLKDDIDFVMFCYWGPFWGHFDLILNSFLRSFSRSFWMYFWCILEVILIELWKQFMSHFCAPKSGVSMHICMRIQLLSIHVWGNFYAILELIFDVIFEDIFRSF